MDWKKLAEFIAARLDEDEALIRRNMDGRGLADGFPDYRTYTDADTDAADDYISHFGPERLLRAVTTGREMLAEYAQAADKFREHAGSTTSDWWAGRVIEAQQVIRYLAFTWSDHPEYDQAWTVTRPAHSSHSATP